MSIDPALGQHLTPIDSDKFVVKLTL